MNRYKTKAQQLITALSFFTSIFLQSCRTNYATNLQIRSSIVEEIEDSIEEEDKILQSCQPGHINNLPIEDCTVGKLEECKIEKSKQVVSRSFLLTPNNLSTQTIPSIQDFNKISSCYQAIIQQSHTTVSHNEKYKFTDICSYLQPTKEWYQGLTVFGLSSNVPMVPFGEITLHTDTSFENLLKNTIGFKQQELQEINQLPKIEYTLFPFNKESMPFNPSTVFCVSEGQAGILINPTAEHVFVTSELMDCVGIAIITSTQAHFAHLSWHGGTDESLESFFEKIPKRERAQAKVILITSNYTEGLLQTYRTLKDFGFKDITANIPPIINILPVGGHHYKASTLNFILTQLEKTAVDQQEVEKAAGIFEDYIQKNYLINGTRVMMVNAKTGQVYGLKNEHNQHIEHIETKIVDGWTVTYKLMSQFKKDRFSAPCL